MPSLDAFSDAVSRLYYAASDPALWEQALHAIEDLTGSAGAVLDFAPLGAAPPMTIAGRFTQEQCAEYARDYMSKCPRIRFLIEHPGIEAQWDWMILSEYEMDRDPTYTWFGIHGLRYHIAGPVTSTAEHRVFFSVQRSRQQGHADAEDVRLFRLLMPHIGQAVRLATQLGTLATRERLESAVLETLPQAVFALDLRGAVVLANSRAEQLLRENDGIAVRDFMLSTLAQQDQDRLDELIRRAASPLSSDAAGWMRLNRPSGAPPFAIFVSHFRPPISLGSESHACVLAIVIDPSRAIIPDLQGLKSVFGTTEAEGKLALALAAGHSIDSAARMLNIAHETARAQLKALFRKTGTNRQQDLVRVLSWIQVSPGQKGTRDNGAARSAPVTG